MEEAQGFHEVLRLNLDSSVECLTQRRREAESAENARNLANTMNDASNLLEAKHQLKGETTNCSGHCYKTTNLQFFSAFSASRGPLRPFGFASLRQPDDFVAGASRLCVRKILPLLPFLG